MMQLLHNKFYQLIFHLKLYIANYQIFKDESNNVKLAGCPDNVKDKIKIEDFKYGSVFSGKLLPKMVKGGVVLVDTDFTIKERK